MTHAVHSCGILDDGKIIYGGEAAGYVLRFPDGRAAYFAGDTNVFSDMQLIQRLKHVIPMHFGTFPPLTGRPEQLADLIRDLPGTEVRALEPGKPVSW